MRHINIPESLSQNSLFDSSVLDATAWWATHLTPQTLRHLQEGWQGVFRRSVLELMPVDALGRHFDPTLGRPTKELYSMAALVLIMEFRDWTIDQAAEAYALDNSIHFALNLPRDHQHLSPRCLDDYRRLVREDELVGGIFLTVTAKLIEELDIRIHKQRLDSTHLFSDMASFGRTKLMAMGVKRFLTALKRHAAESHGTLEPALRERYEAPPARLFGERSSGKEARATARLQVAQDMHSLIERFADDPAINTRSTYGAMARLFTEHCEVREGKVTVRAKSQDAQGQSSHTMQNTSDADAGYDGHKGSGYQVQLAETSDASNEVQIITVCIPQSAGDSDGDAVELAIEEQRAIAAVPDELAADSAYGSDANHRHCAAQGIELISPVPGRPPKSPGEASEVAGKIEDKNEDTSAPGSRARERAGAPEEDPGKTQSSKAERLAGRREREAGEAWRGKYRRRAGIESLNRGLDRSTGIKNLRVRGLAAVSHAVYGKVCGWNILQAARAKGKAARKARREAKTGENPVSPGPLAWLAKLIEEIWRFLPCASERLAAAASAREAVGR